MPALSEKDIEYLRTRFSKRGPLWNQWDYKLRNGNIIIYSPVIPYNPRTGQPDPALRYMCKHLRIVPSMHGPFLLQYWRHTEKWEWLPCEGDIRQIADAIEADELGLCAPIET